MMPQNTQDIPPSPVSALEKVQEIEREKGIRVIRFDTAEPFFEPPQKAIDFTIDAIKNGKYKYSSSWGLRELREKVAEYLSETRQLEYSVDQVLITPGAKFANFALFASHLRPHDKVLLITPYWTSFKAVPSLLGIETVEVPSVYPFHLDEERIKEAMSFRPKVIVINNPHNPTGGVMDLKDIQILEDLAEEYDFKILSDEIDWAYVYPGKRFISPASIGILRDNTVVTDGFSKVFGLTGWRVGFSAGPKESISIMHKIQEHSVSSPVTFAQYGCLGALDDYGAYIKGVLETCSKNRQIAVSMLNEISQIRCDPPEGGFYVYPKLVSGPYGSSLKFAEDLLGKAGVSVMPGEYFGDNSGRFRLSYALPRDELVEGIRRIAAFFEGLK